MRGRIFYGWIIVGTVFLVHGIGVGNQQLIRFLIPIFADQFNTSTGVISFCTAGLLTLVAGVVSPFCGVLINRYSNRTVILFSLALIGAGYIALGFVTHLWQMAAIYALAFSVGTYGLVIAGNAIICEWFVAYRGRALSFAMAGVIVVGFILPPAAAWSLETFELHITFLIVAALVFALIPMTFWLVVERPAQMGLAPDGAKTATPTESAHAAQNESPPKLRDLATNRMFWTIAIIAAICNLAAAVPSTYFIPFAQDAGIAGISASYFLSAISAFTLVGTLVFGRLSESINQRLLALIAIATTAIACLILLAFSNYSAMLMAAIVCGLGSGMVGVLPAIMVAANMSHAAFPLAFGTLSAFMALTYSGSLFLFGQAYDALGTAAVGLQAILIVLAITAVVSRCLPGKTTSSCSRDSSTQPQRLESRGGAVSK